LAPTGYPDEIPIISANDALPGTLKTGFIKGSSSRPDAFIKPVAFSISDAIKKGNSEGIIARAQRCIPLFADARTVSDDRIRPRTKSRQADGINSRRRYIVLYGRDNRIRIIAKAGIINKKYILPAPVFSLI